MRKIISIPPASAFLLVRFRGNQRLQAFLVARALSRHGRRLPSLIFMIELNPRNFRHYLQLLDIVHFGGLNQRGLALLVFRVHVRARIH